MITKREDDKYPLVSFVIVSWNVAELLADCINSIVKTSVDVPSEIVVVDNASSDNSVELLRERFPFVTVMVNAENVGFARANNCGLAHVRGEYVFILNPDTVVHEGTLRKMLVAFKESSNVVLVGPHLQLSDGRTQETCARLLFTLGQALFCNALRLCESKLFGRWFKKKFFSPYDYSLSQEVEAISGAAMLMRSESIHRLKGFGETFLHGGEDLDLCYRVRKDGGTIRYVSDAYITHHLGQSSNQVPVITSIRVAASIKEFFLRAHGSLSAYCFQLIVQFVQCPIMLLVGFAKFAWGSESSEEFRRRWKMAVVLWEWDPANQQGSG